MPLANVRFYDGLGEGFGAGLQLLRNCAADRALAKRWMPFCVGRAVMARAAITEAGEAKSRYAVGLPLLFDRALTNCGVQP